MRDIYKERWLKKQRIFEEREKNLGQVKGIFRFYSMGWTVRERGLSPFLTGA